MSLDISDQRFDGIDNIDPKQIKINSTVPVYMIYDHSNFEHMDNARLSIKTWEDQYFRVKKENILHYGDIMRNHADIDFSLYFSEALPKPEITKWWSFIKVLKKARKHTKPFVIINQNARLLRKNIKFDVLRKNYAEIYDGELNDRGILFDVLSFKWDARQYLPGGRNFNPESPDRPPLQSSQLNQDHIEPVFTTALLMSPQTADWMYRTFAIEKRPIIRSLEGTLKKIYLDNVIPPHQYQNLCVKHKDIGSDYLL